MKISIITPTFNSVEYIKQCIDSVKSNEGYNLTHIICDNNSADGTQNICLAGSKFSTMIYKGGSDIGPANAINKCLASIDSGIVGWLNSDDYYSPGAIDRAISLFKRNSQLKILYGHGVHISSTGIKLGSYPTLPPTTSIKNFFDGSFICQPTVFFRAEVFNEIGLLDESLKTAFDFDLWIRIFKKYRRNQIGFINTIQAYSRLHDQCLTRRYRKTVALEGMQVLSKYFRSAPKNWLETYFNELCDLYPFIEDSRPLLEIVKELLSKSKVFLKPNDLTALIKNFQSDFRLRLSNSQVYVNVQTDGWVSNKLVVKMRYIPGGSNQINLDCKVGWPIKGNIYIRIRSSSGEIEKLKLTSHDEFNIILRVPQTIRNSYNYWIVETRQFFIPEKYIKRSKDTRKLSFRVEGISMNKD